MKKFIVLILPMLIALVLSSCVNTYSVKQEGVFESEDKKFTVLLDGTGWFQGELEKEDGMLIHVELRAARGRFFLYEMLEMGELERICYGDYKQKKDTLILIPEDGDEIVLKKIAEVPDDYLNTGDGSLIDKNQ